MTSADGRRGKGRFVAAIELLCSIWDIGGAVNIRDKERVAIYERTGSHILLVLLGRAWRGRGNSNGWGRWSERWWANLPPSARWVENTINTE
jgi:hypothetical protein